MIVKKIECSYIDINIYKMETKNEKIIESKEELRKKLKNKLFETKFSRMSKTNRNKIIEKHSKKEKKEDN